MVTSIDVERKQMKKLLIGFILMGVAGSASLAQTNFHTNVTNLWYQGHKSNVLAIANTRLAQNTNDIAGLILKMEYNMEFSVMSEISNSFWRVIHVGETITTPNFAARFPSKRENLLLILDVIKEEPISPEELVVEQAKGNINEKPLRSDLFDALQKDGYFD